MDIELQLENGVLNNGLQFDFIYWVWFDSFWVWYIYIFRNERKRGQMSDEEIKTLYNIVDKLEKRIFLLEKVIGKLQLRLGDVVLYIDKKAEQDE